MIEQVLGNLRGGFGGRVDVMLKAHPAHKGCFASFVCTFAVQIDDGFRLG